MEQIVCAGCKLGQPGASLEKRRVRRDDLGRDRRLIAVFAGLGLITLPSVDSANLPLAENFPYRFGQLFDAVAADLSKRKRIGTGEDRFEIEILRQSVPLGQFERQKPRPREREPKGRPASRHFPFDRPLGANLAGYKQKVGHGGFRGVAECGMRNTNGK